MKKIGINIRITEEDFSVWSNGVRQNIFFFAQLLMNIGKYEVFIVNASPDPVKTPITDKLSWDIKKFKTVQFEDIRDDLDMYFVMGAEIVATQGHYLKQRGCKVIYYNCGNRYVIEMEEMLFKETGGVIQDESYLDEIWMIPQLVNSSYYYLETIHKCKVREVPFVWGTEFMDRIGAQLPDGARYSPRPGPRRVACFEPNLNVVKFAMYDVLIAERAYRMRARLFKHFYVTNAMALKGKSKFVSIMNKLDIVKTGITSFEARYMMPVFLQKYTDVVVAHQWENALNYAYLDALYLKYPLVHNATFIKDAGYYYEGFNAQQGAEQLVYAMEHHDKEIDAYEAKSAAVLRRYRNDTPELMRAYEEIIDGMLQ
jgi:hypothetical protein